MELLPLVLVHKSDRDLKACSPVFIHNCLERCIGSYKACSPLRNGNLIVNCCSVQQIKTLLKCPKLIDGAVTVEIAASPLQPLGTRGVIYNVPLDISTEDILACLATHGVQSVKRFRFKSKDSPELKDSTSVFLQFTTADLPGEVKLGYLFFRVKQYIPRPLRCYKYNRCGHVASHCRGKLRCSICGGDYKYSECSAAAPKSPNCGGSHSANDKICPRYQRVTAILKLKTVAKLSYADACKAHNSSRSPPVPNLASQSAFPTLPKSTVDRGLMQDRFLVPLRFRVQLVSHRVQLVIPRATGVSPDQEKLIVTEQIDFSSLLFGNPVTFLAFLVEVIKQTILAKDRNENIDVCQIITEAVGDRMGLPVDAEQLKIVVS